MWPSDFVVAHGVSVFVVKWLLGYIKSHRFTGFAIYRIILGIVLLTFFSPAAPRLKDAPRLVPPEGVYDEFCARFPYEETEDQQSTIDAVLDDLAAGRPMDRLVCGDVGFGKTEVALLVPPSPLR